MSRVKLIVGLGNPGAQYERTRHNAGFWFVDELARRYGGTFRGDRRSHCEATEIMVDGKAAVHLLKPQLFMNRSGLPVQVYAGYRNILPAEILVAHDELDFPPGVAKLKLGGGHGGHNGLRDLMAVLGNAGFARVRLGIGRAVSDDAAAYVLSKPAPDEERSIKEAIGRVVELLPTLVLGGVGAAMNTLNASGRNERARGS